MRGRGIGSVSFLWAGAALLLSAVTTPAAAQLPAWLMPDVRYFAGPIADPLEPRLGIGIVSTNILDRQGPERPTFTRPVDSREVQAVASIGATIPMFHIASWPGGGIVIAAQASVHARFRIERPSRDDFGQDWLVAMPVEVRWDEVSARLRLTHRSSHLGDEFSAASGAQRIEFGGEALDALFAADVGHGARIYAGGGWIFHSNTDNTSVLMNEGRPDRYFLQAGADVVLRPWRDERFDLVAGIDLQSAERTEWQSTLGIAGGVRLHSGPRGVRLTARYVEGTSPLGQFFLTQEEFFSFEFVIDF
ncbi:MAG: DUF1207 domain-containing protein [Longimicrobiales bacterium]